MLYDRLRKNSDQNESVTTGRQTKASVGGLETGRSE